MALAKPAMPGDIWKLFEASLSVEDGVEPYLRRILELCVEWFGATGASIFLLDGSSNRYRLAAQAGQNTSIPSDAVVVPGSGIAGLSIESGQPLLVTDPTRHPLLQGKVNTQRVALGSSIVIPLLAPEEGRVGVLNLARSAAAEPFCAEDLARVESLARQISLAVGNARLITRLHESGKREQLARRKLDAVVQSLAVAVLVLDEKGRITEVNRAARNLIGTGRNWKKELCAVSPELASWVERSSKTGSERKKVYDERLDRSWSVVRSRIEGGGTTISIEEITADERAQREMARLARLAEVGQMTAAIAHEIRNPLTGIRSAAQMLTTSPENSAEFATIIEEEALKLNSLCDEFLDFARPLTLNRSAVDLREMAETVLQRHRGEFEAKEVDLALEIGAGSPTIYGDARRIEQVLLNLLLNALQACDRGGSVRVDLADGRIAVGDTGKGMDKKDLERLFTPFFTTRAQGTGLGLCNVKKVVDAHGGKIVVKSEPGRGSRFEIEIGGAH